VQLGSLSYSRKPIKSEKLKRRELLEDSSVEWKTQKLMLKKKGGGWLGFIWHQTGTNG
jgi:hypothetical protein